MMGLNLNNRQKLRRQVTALSALLASLLAGSVGLLLLQSLLGGVFFGFCAAISTSIPVWFCLGKFLKNPVGSSSGLGWGLWAGVLSLYILSMFSYVIAAALSDWNSLLAFEPRMLKQLGFAIIASPLFGLLAMVYAFILGGFLAPILGAVGGNYLGKALKKAEKSTTMGDLN